MGNHSWIQRSNCDYILRSLSMRNHVFPTRWFFHLFPMKEEQAREYRTPKFLNPLVDHFSRFPYWTCPFGGCPLSATPISILHWLHHVTSIHFWMVKSPSIDVDHVKHHHFSRFFFFYHTFNPYFWWFFVPQPCPCLRRALLWKTTGDDPRKVPLGDVNAWRDRAGFFKGQRQVVPLKLPRKMGRWD